MKEIALSGVSFNDKMLVSLWPFLGLLVGIVLFLCCFTVTSYRVIFRPKIFFIGLMFTLGSLAWMFGDIKSFKERREFLKKETEKSKIRCSDQEYVDKLKAYGYKMK